MAALGWLINLGFAASGVTPGLGLPTTWPTADLEYIRWLQKWQNGIGVFKW